MSLDFDSFTNELKEGDIFHNVSFGSPTFLVISIINKDNDKIEFDGLKFYLYGERNKPIIEISTFKEIKQTIAPSPFKIYRDSETKKNILIRYVFDEKVVVK